MTSPPGKTSDISELYAFSFEHMQEASSWWLLRSGLQTGKREATGFDGCCAVDLLKPRY
jgi:hypothetical protein